MSGRVTMLGISRWAGPGGSYRTVQRFFSQALPWAMLFWVFCRQHVYHPDEVYLLAGDEGVATKAGKHTYGLDRCFSSLYGKPVPGLAFFTWSWVSTQQRRSCPIRVEQVVRSAAEKAASKAKADAKKPTPATAKRRPGRPKGSQNTPKADVPLTPELWRITGRLSALLQLIDGVGSLPSLVLDGHFGKNNALHMARRSHLPLISKLRGDAALYFPYAGPYAGRGPRRTYGRKVDYTKMPEKYLTATTVAGHIHPRVYQAQLLHKEFAHPLNVVIIVKTNLHTQAQAHVILFSRDLTLADASLVDDYGLRFHIECNFRDATQYWGLEDFMHVTPTGVTKAANLSLFIVNVAYRLQAEETIKMLPAKPEPVL
jgi:putative transposase